MGDGLTNDEITKLMFKSYMNSITTTHEKEFYEESKFSNNTNIYSSGILIDSPPVYSSAPTLINVGNDVSLSEYLSYSAIPNINIDSDWFDEKTISTSGNVNLGSFSVNKTNDSERTILRFEKIKLDYLESGSSSFSCTDKSGTNILHNLVPSNYSTTGYSIELYYDKNRNGILTLIGWLTDSTTLGEDFGAALYDTKNGIITFYDVENATEDAEREALFQDKDFYFTATKYIGINNINVLRSLETLGDVSINSSLNVSNNAFVHNEFYVGKDVSFGSHLQVVGDVSMESNLDISENLHVFNQLNVEDDVSFGSHLQVVGDVSMESNVDINIDLHVKGNATFGLVSSNVEDVSNNNSNIYVYGDLRIMDGGNLVIEDISNTTITHLRTDVQITDSLDISNDGTSTAMIVSQLHTNNYKIVEFKDAAETVFSVGKNGNTFIQGDVSMESSLEISNNLLVHNQVFVDKDVSFGSHLFVSGDVSFNSTVEISGLMITKKNFVFQTNTTEKMIIDTSGVKFLNNDPSYSALDISATSALKIPVGTGAQRPSIETTGQIRYNMTTKQFEGYGDTGGWQGLGGITDLDQDTYILAHDNNEIQIFTASYERMKVDACGNIQMFDSNPTYSALDISATSALQIPVGTQNQRPINSENPGALRFNSDTSLCEVYTQSNIWSGLPVYKAEQPPHLHSPSTTEENKSFTISWSKFDEIYKDAYDGKSYPIFLQTYVDVSYSDTGGVWKTIYIGPGNCDNTGSVVTPKLTITIPDSGFVFDDSDGSYSRNDIEFDDKPIDTHNIDDFDQSYKFDFRVYAVNNSGKTPNYLTIEQVGLETTNEPSPPEVTSTDNFQQNSFEIDTSFNVDKDNSGVTINEVTLEYYDISYVLTETKSFEDRDHDYIFRANGNSYTGDNSSETGIILTDLYPGAVYDFQVQVKNTANTNESGYGEPSTSSEFTQITSASNQYIDTDDLNNVNNDNMTFTKCNFSSNISLRINGGSGSSSTTYTLGNSNSYIDISGTSEFYVNYGLQGLDMSGESDMSLVEATVTIKAGSSVSSQTLTYYGTHDPDNVSSSTIDISNGATTYSYQFSSGGTYTDKASSSYNNGGFVYSSTFYRSDDNSLNSIFNDNFKPSTNSYELLYNISSSSTQTNGASYIDKTNTTTGDKTTSTFYVDDYSMNPVIEFTTRPTLSTTATYLFGIPSVATMSIDYDISISDFANYFIPSSGSGVHSGINSISNNSYTITSHTYNSTNSNDSYNIEPPNPSVTVNNATNTGYYDADTSDNLSVYVYYLDHNRGKPSLETQDASSEIYDIGHIFINSERTYYDYSLYTFDGSAAITSIDDVTDASFATTFPMDTDISTTLLRFDGKFVSGGYSTSYNGITITPFSDWSSGYAKAGPNYSSYIDTGIDGFKWIAININGLLPTAGNDDDGRINLSSFKVKGSSVNGGGTYSIESSSAGYDNHFGDINNDDGWIAFLYITQGSGTLFSGDRWGALHKTFKASSGDTSYWELGYSDPKQAVGASSSDSFTSLTTTNLGSVSGAIAGTTGTSYPGLDSNNDIAYGKIPTIGAPDYWDGDVYLVVGLPKGKNSYFSF